jgi:hypothetical protein
MPALLLLLLLPLLFPASSLVVTPSTPLPEVWAEAQRLEALSDPSARSPLLLGKYEMLRQWNPDSIERADVSAAGGAWVSGLGRSRFASLALYQHLLPPVAPAAGPTAINLVVLRLFSLLTVTVVLRGDCAFLPPSARGDLSAKAVLASFDPPLLRFSLCGLPLPTLRIGPRSEVTLDASFVDSELRVARGRSGVRFYCPRLPEGSREGDEYRALVGARVVLGKRSLVGGVAAAAAACASKGRFFGAGALALLAAFAATRTGGIVRETSRQSLEQQGAAQAQ